MGQCLSHCYDNGHGPLSVDTVACTTVAMQWPRDRRINNGVMQSVSRQQIGKHFPAATNTHATVELLLEMVFPTTVGTYKGVIRKTIEATQGLGPERDCAGKDQQHIHKTDPSSRQRGRPTKEKQDRNCQTAINIWPWVPDGARHQDYWLTDLQSQCDFDFDFWVESTVWCEDRTWEREAEESPLLEAVARKRLVKTQAGNGLARAVVICELWRLVVAL
jgi:hypothetical protein